MKRLAFITVAVWLIHAGFASAQVPCKQQPDFTPLLPNTWIALGPFMYSLLTSTDPNINPALINAVIGAHDAWLGTNAAGRLGGYAGSQPGQPAFTQSDCPADQPLQLGLFDFVNTPCSTLNAYVQLFHIPHDDWVALSDYHIPSTFAQYGVSCPKCGTKSMLLNARKAWSLNPAPNQFDVQSIMAHEFGHILGLAHMNDGSCSDALPYSCAQDGARNTMGSYIYMGDTCERDLNDHDKSNANAIYPMPILKADIVVYRPGTGHWLIRRSFDGGLTDVGWGCASCGDKPVAADYDGDGFSDVAVYRGGEWLIQRSSNGTTIDVWWGCVSCGDIPVPADYDGDGRADIAVYRPTTGQWFILRSSDGGLTQTNWGCVSCGDVPVSADYDGDHRADIAVYRSSTGEWFILRSSDGGLTQLSWGCVSCGDIPVPADYDGDGRTDIAVYRPSTGEWFILRSSDGGLTYLVVGGCASCGDKPVAADYDGDRRTDPAVYRPSTGEWFILQSSDGYKSLVWNAPGQQDQPVKFLKR
jgi:VCBS repeat protein/matrixin